MAEEEKPTGQEEIDALGRQVFRHRNADSLYMKRVPKDTVEIFTKWADENFIGDYGFAFKWMVDNLINQDPIISTLQDHEARLAMLENKPKTVVKTMLSGRKIELPAK